MFTEPLSSTEYNQNTYTSYHSIPKIRVVVRKRPLNKKELKKGELDVVEIPSDTNVIVKEAKTKVDLTKYCEEHSFQFDRAFDKETANEALYLETIRPMIEAAFNKIKVTCFAYGQTGSGKTFTMMGNSSSLLSTGNQIPGMYLLAAYDIFSLLQQEQYKSLTIWLSFYEIYCGKLFDLLNERAVLTAREDGKQNICIVGLTEKHITSLTELMTMIEYGIKARTVGVTGANSDSSRSHGIIQIVIRDIKGNQYGKISFIDLAGSERAADTIDTNKQTRIDGAEINKSLLALKECIRALDQYKKHTPFRGSKLTLVLRDSFIGNCKTLMIANISPSQGCAENTLNTLRYADRVKELRGKQPEMTIGNDAIYSNSIEGKIKYNENEELKDYVSNEMSIKKTKPDHHTHYNMHNHKFKKRSTYSGSFSSIDIDQKASFRMNNQSNDSLNHINSKLFNQSNNNHLNSSSMSKMTSKLQINIPNIIPKGNPNVPVLNKGVNDPHRLINNSSSNNQYESIAPTMRESFNKNIEENRLHNSFAFIDNYTKFQSIQLKKPDNILSDRLRTLSNEIALKGKELLQSHKIHFDKMVEIMKKEMSLIQSSEKRNNIEAYANSLLNILNNQEEKIKMRKIQIQSLCNIMNEEKQLKGRINNNSNDKNNEFNQFIEMEDDFGSNEQFLMSSNDNFDHLDDNMDF